jgi:hypothetical protein
MQSTIASMVEFSQRNQQTARQDQALEAVAAKPV